MTPISNSVLSEATVEALIAVGAMTVDHLTPRLGLKNVNAGYRTDALCGVAEFLQSRGLRFRDEVDETADLASNLAPSKLSLAPSMPA